MTHDQKLYSGISKAAWGYFFLYFDINFNTVSILPDFVGYCLFVSAIKELKEEERELELLQTLGILLVMWHTTEWFFSWSGATLDGRIPFLDIVICLVNLYFHFQLLTNLASIAQKYQPAGVYLDGKLLQYRTLQTIMLTGIIILSYLSPWLEEVWALISIGLVVVYLIAGICLMKALFDLRRCVREHSGIIT